MSEALSLDNLAGVSETLLIPLFGRAWEYQNPRPLLKDETAHALGQRLLPLLAASPSPFHQAIAKRRWPDLVMVMMSLRTRFFDKVCREFIHDHPDGQLVMLGCGLDSRFERVGCPDVDWINLDLPEVIALRRQLFEPRENVTELAMSALDPALLKQLDPQRPTLFVAEGLLMYLPRAQIRQLFRMLAPIKGEFVAEVVSDWSTKTSAISRKVLNVTTGLSSGVGYAGGLINQHEPESWDRRIRLLQEWTYFEEREPRMGLLNLSFGPFRRVQWIVHYSLGDR